MSTDSSTPSSAGSSERMSTGSAHPEEIVGSASTSGMDQGGGSQEAASTAAAASGVGPFTGLGPAQGHQQQQPRQSNLLTTAGAKLRQLYNWLRRRVSEGERDDAPLSQMQSLWSRC
jgi:hypothetical protein